VLLSVLLSRELLGSDLPECVAGLNEVATARRFAAEIIAQMTAMREIPPESLAYFRFMLQVRERRSDRARFVWRLATTPSVGEWQAMPMPDILSPLYPVIRAARLARRLSSSLLHSHADHFGKVQGLAAGTLLDLLAATEAVGDEEGFGRGIAHSGEKF
jgi:hypothetical protein